VSEGVPERCNVVGNFGEIGLGCCFDGVGDLGTDDDLLQRSVVIGPGMNGHSTKLVLPFEGVCLPGDKGVVVHLPVMREEPVEKLSVQIGKRDVVGCNHGSCLFQTNVDGKNLHTRDCSQPVQVERMLEAGLESIVGCNAGGAIKVFEEANQISSVDPLCSGVQKMMDVVAGSQANSVVFVDQRGKARLEDFWDHDIEGVDGDDCVPRETLDSRSDPAEGEESRRDGKKQASGTALNCEVVDISIGNEGIKGFLVEKASSWPGLGEEGWVIWDWRRRILGVLRMIHVFMQKKEKKWKI
jgi:hypothetical protein